MFVYPKEVPPDLYVFQTWHIRNPYRRAMVADELWKNLLKAVKLSELVAYIEKPIGVHDRVHHAFRFAVDIPNFIKELPHLEPREDWVGGAIHEFVKWYAGTHPEALVEQESDHNGDEKPNEDEISEESKPKKRGRPPKVKE